MLFRPVLAMGIMGVGSLLGQTESCISNLQVIFQSGGGGDQTNDEDDARSLFEASLTGGASGSGRARYEVRTDRTDFDIEIESGEPGATLDVVVDGVLVDQITLNDLGFGELEYRDPPDDNPDDNEVPFPDNFPTIGEGTVVEVGDSSGTLTLVADDSADEDGDDDEGTEGDDDDDDDDDDGGGDVISALQADLTGGASGSGRARYEVRTDRTEFDVEIESGEPGATLDVVVDGVLVDQITLNDLGFGELEYRDPPDDNPEPNEFPFPQDFPAIGDGTVVEVGDHSGTLAPLAP